MKKRCKNCEDIFSLRYKAQVFCSVACANRFNLNNKNKISFPKEFSKELAELFGVLLGDGGIEKYFIRIYLNRKADKGYSQKLMVIIRKLFPGIKVTCLDRPKRGTEEVQISSIDACNYFRGIGFDSSLRTVPSWIIDDSEYTKATIRGLFDTEGSIGMKFYHGGSSVRVYGQLTVTNKNKNILCFLERELRRLGYKPTNNSQKNIYISNRKDIKRYFKEIGTNNPKMEKKFDEMFRDMSE